MALAVTPVPWSATGQVEREHHESQLALPVRLPAVVLTRQHHVIEVDGGLSD
jgi:hypothetical protein